MATAAHEKCSLGHHLKEDCHKSTFTHTHTGLVSLQDLSTEELTLIKRRSCIPSLTTMDTICLHHKSMYLQAFVQAQRDCINLFDRHKTNTKRKKHSKDLRPISLDMADKLMTKLNLTNVKPGSKLCKRCYEYAMGIINEPDVSSTSNDEDMDTFESPQDAVDDLNQSAEALDCSPVKIMKLPVDKRLGYAKKKVSSVHSKVVNKMAAVLGEPSSALLEDCKKCEDKNSELDNIIKSLQDKCKVATKQEKIQILTLVPTSWSLQKTYETFAPDVSMYQVRQARKLRQQHGILSTPEAKKGRNLPLDVEKKVFDFYHKDDISRVMPGAKDFVSVKINGERQWKTKRLLLGNLNELYEKFKECESDLKIGFSKFCQLRPKWCILAGASGTHSVCVCTIHQNLKLMLAAMDSLPSYHELMDMVVCDVKAKECMLHRCKNCPGIDAVEKFVSEKILEDYDLDDTISHQQWVTTDRTTIVTIVLTAEDFIKEVIKKLERVIPHHFISKHQSEYLTNLKKEENLEDGTVIIIMDFAENYSFVVQDAAQGYHWDNTQATIHPYAVYFKKNGKVEHLSLACISDHMKHDTITVHEFLKVVIQYLKNKIPDMKKIIYFSDGAASQYKNYKNFANLRHHHEDFGLEAEWNFFGTSHGKNACDGIGGTIKRLARKASLQRPIDNQILTPHDLFSWSDQHLPNVHTFYVSSATIEAATPKQESRFQSAKSIPGTRDNHYFVPVHSGVLHVGRVSGDMDFRSDQSCRRLQSFDKGQDPHQLQPGQYVACVYDKKWYLGNVIDTSDDFDDVRVSFMHPNGPSTSFSWPTPDDKCWVPKPHILCVIPAPVTSTGRQYTISRITQNQVLDSFKDFN